MSNGWWWWWKVPKIKRVQHLELKNNNKRNWENKAEASSWRGSEFVFSSLNFGIFPGQLHCISHPLISIFLAKLMVDEKTNLGGIGQKRRKLLCGQEASVADLDFPVSCFSSSHQFLAYIPRHFFPPKSESIFSSFFWYTSGCNCLLLFSQIDVCRTPSLNPNIVKNTVELN